MYGRLFETEIKRGSGRYMGVVDIGELSICGGGQLERFYCRLVNRAMSAYKIVTLGIIIYKRKYILIYINKYIYSTT